MRAGTDDGTSSLDPPAVVSAIARGLSENDEFVEMSVLDRRRLRLGRRRRRRQQLLPEDRHVAGSFNAEPDLAAIDVDELEGLIRNAWRCQAPAALVRSFDEQRGV